mmetsp:Transcript_64384/g.149786  ORF Transcript_64384/g.149786 Transcript_64384/m.149786 type:complete len:219 (-) Transcript_64384:87-743(-)
MRAGTPTSLDVKEQLSSSEGPPSSENNGGSEVDLKALIAHCKSTDSQHKVWSSDSHSELSQERSSAPDTQQEEAPSEVWSKGSAFHSSGDCRPCHFFAGGKAKCRQGSECNFCHLPHTPRPRPPGKVKRARAKRQVTQLIEKAAAEGAPSEQIKEMADKLGEKNHYTKCVVASGMRNLLSSGTLQALTPGSRSAGSRPPGSKNSDSRPAESTSMKLSL